MAEECEDEIAVEGGAPSGVADVAAFFGPDEIVDERSQAGNDAWVLADPGSVLGEGGVA